MFTIKKATTNDIQLINEMAQIVFPATYREILSKEQLDYMMDWMYSPKNLRKQMEEEGHIYYIAYKDGEAAGYVSIQPEGEHLFHLQKIYVLPLFQGCRLGKALFEQAVKAIKEIHPGPCEMHLNVNRNNKALQFYQHLGMEKVAEGDFHIGNGYYMNDYIIEALAQVFTTTFLPDSFIARILFSSFTLIYGPFFNERLIVYSINQITFFFSQ